MTSTKIKVTKKLNENNINQTQTDTMTQSRIELDDLLGSRAKPLTLKEIKSQEQIKPAEMRQNEY